MNTEIEKEEIEESQLRRVNSACPFCNASMQSDNGISIRYICGSFATRETGKHTKQCQRRLS